MATQHPTHPSQALTGALFVLVSAIAFSSKAVMIKLAYGYHVDAETLLTLRMAFAAPIYLGIAVWVIATGRSAHLNRKDVFALLLLGTVGGYLPMWADFAGLDVPGRRRHPVAIAGYGICGRRCADDFDQKLSIIRGGKRCLPPLKYLKDSAGKPRQNCLKHAKKAK
jgi:hypothetical protein